MIWDPYAEVETGNAFDPKARLCWESTDNLGFQLDENTLLVSISCRIHSQLNCLQGTFQPPPSRVEFDRTVPYNNPLNYTVAITGDVFRWIVDYGSEEVLNRVCIMHKHKLFSARDSRHKTDVGPWTSFRANVTG